MSMKLETEKKKEVTVKNNRNGTSNVTVTKTTIKTATNVPNDQVPKAIENLSSNEKKQLK